MNASFFLCNISSDNNYNVERKKQISSMIDFRKGQRFLCQKKEEFFVHSLKIDNFIEKILFSHFIYYKNKSEKSEEKKMFLWNKQQVSSMICQQKIPLISISSLNPKFIIHHIRCDKGSTLIQVHENCETLFGHIKGHCEYISILYYWHELYE